MSTGQWELHRRTRIHRGRKLALDCWIDRDGDEGSNLGCRACLVCEKRVPMKTDERSRADRRDAMDGEASRQQRRRAGSR